MISSPGLSCHNHSFTLSFQEGLRVPIRTPGQRRQLPSRGSCIKLLSSVSSMDWTCTCGLSLMRWANTHCATSATCVIYDTVRGYISTIKQFMEESPSLLFPTFPLRLWPRDSQQFKMKTVCHLPSRAPCEVVSICSHFTWKQKRVYQVKKKQSWRYCNTIPTRTKWKLSFNSLKFKGCSE